MNTRHKFFWEIGEMMRSDPDIYFLTGDLGYSYIEGIQEKYPDRVINCGCIEQSMVGIAVGMAIAGKKPYVYSTTPFLLFRALEQIRNDVVRMCTNVKIIGVSMSGFLGFTHNLLHPEEDINICKNISMKYLAPKLEEVERDIGRVYKSKEPFYIRL